MQSKKFAKTHCEEQQDNLYVIFNFTQNFIIEFSSARKPYAGQFSAS